MNSKENSMTLYDTLFDKCSRFQGEMPIILKIRPPPQKKKKKKKYMRPLNNSHQLVESLRNVTFKIQEFSDSKFLSTSISWKRHSVILKS